MSPDAKILRKIALKRCLVEFRLTPEIRGKFPKWLRSMQTWIIDFFHVILCRILLFVCEAPRNNKLFRGANRGLSAGHCGEYGSDGYQATRPNCDSLEVKVEIFEVFVL